MTPQEISKIIVEKGEGGCWHERSNLQTVCKKCGNIDFNRVELRNPDFSLWENFGRLLKVAFVIEQEENIMVTVEQFLAECEDSKCIDQIPLLVATEIARVLKEER